MEDKLCLIPYSELEFDKTYTNISEYFLRDNRSVRLFLALNGADERIVNGTCSDFELLLAFLKIICENGEENCPVANTFKRIIRELVGGEEIEISDAESVWINTSSALMDRKLRSAVASCGMKKIGIPLLPSDYFDGHFVAIRGVELAPVLCPFGTKSVSLDTIELNADLAAVEEKINTGVSESSATALFLSGYVFEKPNEYSASKALEKRSRGQSLLNKERDALASQLLRITALASAELDKELMIFLPFAPDVKSMGAAAELLDYVDASLGNKKLNVTVFGGDAVSICMAEAIATTEYKNITAASGVSGNGSDIKETSIWCSSSSGKCYASLAHTPALLSGR